MLSNVMKDWLGVCFVTALGLAILIFIPILFDLFEVLQMTKYVVLALFALRLAYMAIGWCALFAAALGYFMFYGRLNDVYMGVVTLVVTLILWKFINHTAGPEYIIGKARLGGFNGMPSIPIMTLPWRPDVELEPGQMFQYFMAILIVVYLFLNVLIK